MRRFSKRATTNPGGFDSKMVPRLTFIFLSAFIDAFFFVVPPSWAKQIGPESSYCREINDPSSGTQIILEPGEYRGSCQIRRGGKPGAPLVIRALDSKQRPRIRYDRRDGNVFEIYADYVVVQGLEFGPTNGEVDGIRIFSGDHVRIEECIFNDMGGIAIVANHASITGLIARQNRIQNSASTAMYFGCHDGAACTASDVVIEENFISGVSARPPQVGYGIQLKLNSTGTIRGNIILGTKGPGIMTYGATNPGAIIVIEGNYVSGSRESSGIVVGGGPAKVRNNIAVANADSGVALEDYGRRGLLRNVFIEHNSMFKNFHAGLRITAETHVQGEVSANIAAATVSPGAAFSWPAERTGLRITGNKDCRDVSCFRDPENGDFTPVDVSTLLKPDTLPGRRAETSADYFGHPRGRQSAAGAVEPPGGRVVLVPDY